MATKLTTLDRIKQKLKIIGGLEPMKKNRPVANDGNGAKALGVWLKDRCKKEHLSVRQAGIKAGVSHATISDIIKGHRPSAVTIVKLAEAFGNDGKEKAELKDKLLSLSGYRSEGKQEGISEPVARVIDKLNHLNPEQLDLVEQLTSFIAQAGQPGMKGVRSSTGVLVLPRLRLNFYLSFDEEDKELGQFSNLPIDMQKDIIDLAERYKKEKGRALELQKADERSSSK